MSIVTVLHISDTHFKAKEPKQKNITRFVIDAVEQHIKNGHQKPSICVFSGDITHSAQSEQFGAAEHWLEDLSDVIDHAPLFLIPGNHDIARLEKDSTEEKNHSRQLEAAHHTLNNYQQWHNEVKKAQLLEPFFNWHKKLKSGDNKLNVVSDWNAMPPFGCHYEEYFNKIKTHLIGLNSAILSCRDKEAKKLVVDENTLEALLEKKDYRKELIILATHHPIKIDNDYEQWLADWNDDSLKRRLFQQSGPHIYLHGHLHKSIGVGTSRATGQSLGYFGAGATYDHDKYPMSFGFYDIHILVNKVQSWIYRYNRISGKWEFQPKESHESYTGLPHETNTGTTDQANALIKEMNGEMQAIEDVRVKLDHTYKKSLETTKRIVRELYGVRKKEFHHNYEGITSHTKINSNADGEVAEEFIISPDRKDKPLHFWELGIWADPESDEMPFFEDIDLKLDGRDIDYLPTLDEPREKHFCIFFLPEIRPNNSRTVQLSWTWPRYVPRLLLGRWVEFEWTYKAADRQKLIDLTLILEFDASLGDLEYCVDGMVDKGCHWRKERNKQNDPTRLVYRCKQACHMQKGYKIRVRRKASS